MLTGKSLLRFRSIGLQLCVSVNGVKLFGGLCHLWKSALSTIYSSSLVAKHTISGSML